MRLTYTTTVEDWLAFYRHALLRDPQSVDALAIWRWFIAIFSGAIAAYVFSDVSGPVSLAAGVTAFVVMAFLFSHLTRASAMAEVRKLVNQKKYLPLFTSERTLEISNEGLRSESVVGQQLVRWHFVEGLDETPVHVCVRLPFRSGFVIPKKPEQAIESFLAELRRRIGGQDTGQSASVPHRG
jgi:hypothetical protein